ncbi:MAG TPA: beta-ketoacyl-[acyl-carrier-protein] synthase family protein, partial [Ktedonobacteraceae bacterium]|nr:beta-ketoacyl-[acyl-carrier-protein] synthase family protein [Ktedonobacteraceae bacterium]
MQRRVVITGLGVVASNGIGKEQFWNACVAGHSGIRRITRFDASPLPSQIAGEIPDFDLEALGLTSTEHLHLDRGAQLGIAAANLALQDAGLLFDTCTVGADKSAVGTINRPLQAVEALYADKSAVGAINRPLRDAMGVYMGAAMASIEEGEKLWVQATSRGTHLPCYPSDGFIPPTLLLTHIPAASIATHHQLHGPCMVISTGCSAGADAIGQAFWAIQEGRADYMLAGGTDSAITYAGINVFCVLGAVSTRNDEPERASRPYDRDRDGFVMAEGAGVVILEDRALALARGAHVYAEIIAFVSNSNAYHMTALPADGAPLQQLLRQALDEAHITSKQLDYINSHGSSTPANEAAETVAYKAVFGEQAYHIPISATKSMIGHTQGAASAIETIVTALALDRQIIPPTINQEHPDPQCDLDYVPNVARPSDVQVALTHSSGFGGVNTALVLARADWIDSHPPGTRQGAPVHYLIPGT